MRKKVFGVLVFVLLAALVSFGQEPEAIEKSAFHFGAGAEFIGSVPFFLLGATYQNFGADLGVGMATEAGISIVWYFASGKYYTPLPVLNNVVRPYLGGGVIGLRLSTSIEGIDITASVTGVNIMGGIEFSFAPL